MMIRYTIQTLQAGQPRPYGPHVLRVRVTFEWSYQNEEGGWQKRCVREEYVRSKLPGLECGFTDYANAERDPSMAAHFRAKLDWLKEIEPGVWEFQTTTPFTD